MFFILEKNLLKMKHILIVASCILFISCGHSPLVSQLQGSDSLAISFLKPGTDDVIKVVESNNPYAIKDLLRFADGEPSDEFKCGYDGKALFYKKGIPTGDITFNYSGDGCQHFLYMANGKLAATKMSNEAIDFFKALAASNK
jgi:hypothetical protein